MTGKPSDHKPTGSRSQDRPGDILGRDNAVERDGVRGRAKYLN